MLPAAVQRSGVSLSQTDTGGFRAAMSAIEALMRSLNPGFDPATAGEMPAGDEQQQQQQQQQRNGNQADDATH